MLRLIDIVLILLFGFISISHVDRAWEVDLPRASFIPDLPPDFEDWIIVAVDGEGYVCGAERLRLPDGEALGRWLEGEAAAGASHVRLRADRQAPGRSVAQVTELCRRAGLNLALEVTLETTELGEASAAEARR
jgi:biopolymer transport protein ExbD